MSVQVLRRETSTDDAVRLPGDREEVDVVVEEEETTTSERGDVVEAQGGGEGADASEIAVDSSDGDEAGSAAAKAKKGEVVTVVQVGTSVDRKPGVALVEIFTNEDRIYDEVEIEDMDFESATDTWYYPCPCGDRFAITMDQLYDGEEIAHCPSCSLRIKVIYDPDDFADDTDDDDDDDSD